MSEREFSLLVSNTWRLKLLLRTPKIKSLPPTHLKFWLLKKPKKNSIWNEAKLTWMLMASFWRAQHYKGKNIASFVVGLIPLVGPILSAFPVVIYYNIKTIQKEDAEFNASQKANLQKENQAAQESAMMEQAQIEEEEAAEEDLEEEENTDEQDGADEEQVEEEQAREPEPEPEEEEPTGQDALDMLNNKQNRNKEDNELLRQASEIMRSGNITPAARNNRVLLAAYTKYQSGIREYNPNNPNPDPQKSYKFSTTHYQE
jgi:flagellar biosynthesis GTPase FlhF